jgi:hypothetical protein
MALQDTRLAPPSALARPMFLPAQSPEVEPPGAPARTEICAQVTPDAPGGPAALPLLLVLPALLLSPFIYDLLVRLWALSR